MAGKIDLQKKQIKNKIKLQFVKKTFSSLTMKEIADLAETGKGSLYYTWSSKDVLLREIVTDDIAETLDRFNAVISNQNLISALEEAFDFRFETGGTTELDWQNFIRKFFDVSFPIEEQNRLCGDFSLFKHYFINDSLKHLILLFHDNEEMKRALRTFPNIKEYRVLIWEKIFIFVLKNRSVVSDTVEARELIHDLSDRVVRNFDAVLINLISCETDAKKKTLLEEEKEKFLNWYWSEELPLVEKKLKGEGGIVVGSIVTGISEKQEEPVNIIDIENLAKLAAVIRDGDSLGKINSQTQELVLAAVTNCGQALKYVKNPTALECLVAVARDGLALEHVPKKMRTNLLRIIAAIQNGKAIEFFDR
jgi:AcrR family transcriptional regulator